MRYYTGVFCILEYIDMANGYGRAVAGSGTGAMRLGFGAATFALVVGSAVYGEVVHGYGLLRKGDPDFTPFGRARIGFSALAALLLYFALRPVMQILPVRIEDRNRGMVGIVLAAAFLLAVAAAVHFVPTALNDYVREMQPLGMATEVLLIAAIGSLLMAAWGARGKGEGRLLAIFPPGLVLTGMAGVVFLILMEEMSWGQHWIGWATPEFFSRNVQNETNLHNFYTYQFEAIYYTSAIFCFIVMPWCWPRGAGAFFAQVEPYLPSRFFALMALPVASLMYEAWNIVPYQVWYFLGLMIGVDIARRIQPARLRAAAFGLVIVYALTMLVFLFGGEAMVDGYELSEVREFYIAFLFLAFGGMLMERFSGKTPLFRQTKAHQED